MSKVNSDRCDDEHLPDFSILNHKNLSHFLLIKPYLEYYWNKQFAVFKELLLKEIELEKSNLNESKQKQIGELQRDLVKAHNGVN